MPRRRHSEELLESQERNSIPKLDIRKFNPDEEKWEYYHPYFELELKLARIQDEDDKKGLLLTKVGPQIFKLLVDRFRPSPVTSQSYTQLLEVISNYYYEGSSITSDRVAFSMRWKEENETVSEFLNTLRALAGRCEFGESLQERIRDQVIVGINNNEWQKELLKTFPTNSHSLRDVEKLTLQLEQSNSEQKRLAEMASVRTSYGVNKISTFKNKNKQGPILQDIFARFGLPKIIVSDHGPQLTSQNFEQFCKQQNIKHVKTTPYHPRSNGLAERAVKTFKTRFAASRNSGDNQRTRLAKYLASYRAAVHRTTGKSPAEMMYGRPLRTKLSLLRPNVNDRIEYNLLKQKMNHDRSPLREFEVGEKVWIKRRKEDKRFSQAVVIEKNGPLSYVVDENGIERRVHADQMRNADFSGGGDVTPLQSLQVI